MAAWAGRRKVDGLFTATHADFTTKVVKFLLTQSSILSVIALRGTPPMTSSCGGRGPFTAAVWAERKVSPNLQMHGFN